jgi:hypothetical protein
MFQQKGEKRRALHRTSGSVNGGLFASLKTPLVRDGWAMEPNGLKGYRPTSLDLVLSATHFAGAASESLPPESTERKIDGNSLNHRMSTKFALKVESNVLILLVKVSFSNSKWKAYK